MVMQNKLRIQSVVVSTCVLNTEGWFRNGTFIFIIFFIYLTSCAQIRKTTTSSTSYSQSEENQASTGVTISKEERIPDLSNFRPNDFGSSFLHACEDSVLCYRINHFEITSNYFFNCYENYLPIFFIIESIDNRNALLFENLNQNGVSIEDSQSFSNNCRKIRSINETNGINKEQLYRYWLRKGLDQFSLSLLFGNNTSRDQISSYLSHIREAIYKDFVPFFLGCNKEREFFLKHNNEMVINLFELESDDLAVVIDGTYTRLEKSANNKFQYSCWRFRDIFDLLKNELKLNPKIPTCSQLEDQNESSNVKQLTSKQTTEKTACYKIEKQTGMIKNFKALDNIRNTQAGHIQIDYRITCAMINFTHKPTCPDKENAKKIAFKLKEKLDFENNLLSGLLKKQFGTKGIFSIDHNSIKDFPKLRYRQRSISLFGNQTDYFVKFIIEYQRHTLFQICSEGCIKNNSFELSSDSE
ncbi:unnamed protein product [Brachionus calyciflorus]|uniref:Uncharacterized protein n=1 Tax=Brachionus calyciflorus TaxID=104777 RepID=A0A814IKM6_9BILA|nr:unnamed protein product [Brachionus calyciflorus]